MECSIFLKVKNTTGTEFQLDTIPVLKKFNYSKYIKKYLISALFIIAII